VQITVTNVSDQRQAYNGNLCGQGYQVFNAAGVNVGPATGCLLDAKLVQLDPGDHAVFTREWTADAPSVATAQQPAPLAPGTYTLIGAVSAWQGISLSNTATTIEVTP
jgi:hypothetical protein